jgi:hypothetical protein
MATGRPRIETWANGGSSTLNGAINNSVTSLVVTSASSFPSYPDFRIKIDSELLNVTAVSGTTFTVERGAEGTTPASHTDTTAVTHEVTAGSLDRAWRDTFGADYTNGYPYNRILNEGATATASSFTWFNQGSGTCTDADDGGLKMTTGASEALNQLRGKEITAPSTPWVCSAYVHLGNGMARYNGSGAGTMGGLMMRENSSGEIYYLFVRTDVIAMWRMTNSTTFSADVDTFIDNEAEEIWLQVGDDGTDVYGKVSYNGYDWVECFDEGRTSFMAGGPDRIGFGMMNGSGAAAAEVYFKSWILE